jgi:DNA-directed RNA polymerase specialized sigma subunit
MTVSHIKAKNYLSQVYRIEQRIANKIEQIQLLRELAEKVSAALSDAPPSCTRNVHRMEDNVCKMANLQSEIKADMQTLIGLKHEIIETIKRVESEELQLLLELRYLCFKNWAEIAVKLNCVPRHVYRLHDKALAKINFHP